MEQVEAFLSRTSTPAECHLHIVTDPINLVKYVPVYFQIKTPFTFHNSTETNHSSYLKRNYPRLSYAQFPKMKLLRIKPFNCLLTLLLLSPFHETSPFKPIKDLSAHFKQKLIVGISSSKLFFENSASANWILSKQFQDYTLIWVTNWYSSKSKNCPANQFFISYIEMISIHRFSHCPVFLINIKYYRSFKAVKRSRPRVFFVCFQCSLKSGNLKLIFIGKVEPSGEVLPNFVEVRKCLSIVKCLKIWIQKSILLNVINLILKPHNLCKGIRSTKKLAPALGTQILIMKEIFCWINFTIIKAKPSLVNGLVNVFPKLFLQQEIIG